MGEQPKRLASAASRSAQGGRSTSPLAFSLAGLLVFICLLASGIAAFTLREPWQLVWARSCELATGLYGFSPDGKRILVDESWTKLLVVDAEDGRILSQLSPDGTVLDASYMPDGKKIAVLAKPGTLAVWDGDGGGKLESCAFAESLEDDGGLLCLGTGDIITVSSDDTIRLWSTAPLKQKMVLPNSSLARPPAVASPNGNLLACSRGGLVKWMSRGQGLRPGTTSTVFHLWSLETGTLVLQGDGHTNWISAVGFSPDGRLVATGSGDNSVRIWELVSGHEEHVLLGHKSLVTKVEFSSDSRRLVSLGQEDKALVWDVSSGRPICGLSLENGTFPTDLRLLGDSERVLSIIVRDQAESQFVVWDARSGQVLAQVGESMSGYATDNNAKLSRDHSTIAKLYGGRLGLYARRFPEWWWGHFYRPEVWLAIIFCSLWLWRVAGWFRARRKQAVGSGSPVQELRPAPEKTSGPEKAGAEGKTGAGPDGKGGP